MAEWLEGKALVANPIPNAVEHPRRWAQNLELKAPPGDRFSILNHWAYALMLSSIQKPTITNCPPGQLSESAATNAPSNSDPRKKITHAPESGTKSKQLPQTNCPPGQLSESDATNAPSKSGPRKKFTQSLESSTKSNPTTSQSRQNSQGRNASKKRYFQTSESPWL